jgi:hypothetical protein
LILDPGGVTTTGFEAGNTVTCIAFSAGVAAMVEDAKTTVGAWNILASFEAMTGSLVTVTPAIRIVRPNAEIPSFSPDVVHLEGIRIRKLTTLEGLVHDARGGVDSERTCFADESRIHVPQMRF